MATTEAEIDQLRKDLQKLRTDFENLGATLGRTAYAGVRETGERICETARDLGGLRQTKDHLTRSIEENPVAAALAALGVGVLLGRLCSGRRR